MANTTAPTPETPATPAQWEPFDKHPDEFVPGDVITVRPIGPAVVTASYAAGNYYNSNGWILRVKSPVGETVLIFGVASLSGPEAAREGDRRVPA